MGASPLVACGSEHGAVLIHGQPIPRRLVRAQKGLESAFRRSSQLRWWIDAQRSRISYRSVGGGLRRLTCRLNPSATHHLATTGRVSAQWGACSGPNARVSAHTGRFLFSSLMPRNPNRPTCTDPAEALCRRFGPTRGTCRGCKAATHYWFAVESRAVGSPGCGNRGGGGIRPSGSNSLPGR